MPKSNYPHRVVFYRWVSGVLETEARMVRSLEHALKEIEEALFHEAKIYDVDGDLVKALYSDCDTDTYC